LEALAAELAAALEALAVLQADNGALAAENEQLRATIGAIKALLA
jgi:cell division protein FtsB